MRRFALASLAALAGAPAMAADVSHPTVVELFQSQGCSSCPPANASLIEFVKRPDVLALNFSVDYWDRLGWKDTFDSPAYTARQYAYARSLGDSGVYTPEIIVNGRAAGVGDTDAVKPTVAPGGRACALRAARSSSAPAGRRGAARKSGSRSTIPASPKCRSRVARTPGARSPTPISSTG